MKIKNKIATSSKKCDVKKMEYKEIVLNQIDRIRQIRTDEVTKYPIAIETLWLLSRNKKTMEKINYKKKELELKSSQSMETMNLDKWDIMFKFTLDTFREFEDVTL